MAAANVQGDGAGYAAPSTVSPEHKFFPLPVQIASGAGATTSEMVIGQMPQGPEETRAEVTEHGFTTNILIRVEKCSRCHQEITRQWSTSAHRYSPFKNLIIFLRPN